MEDTSKPLGGLVAAVTGAAGGIGAEVCRALRRAGATVAGLDLLVPSAHTEPGERWFSCDVSEEHSVRRAFDEVEEWAGPVDLLVNNAGLLRRADVASTTVELWESVFAVNARGTFLCTQRALPGMRRRGFGRIVTVSSSAGLTGGSSATAAYAASKAAAIAFTKAVSREAAADGVTANSIAPYVIDTPMIEGMADIEGLRSRIPVGRSGTPGDVAVVVRFLCSPEAGYITGETLRLSGGALS